MPIFRYEAKKGPRQTVEGAVEADSRDAALEKLARMGLAPLRVAEGGAEEKKNIRRVPAAATALFFRQTADLLDSGVPLLKSLRVARDQADHAGLSVLVGELLSAVEGGKTLADAMEARPEAFAPLHAGLVRAGESTGASAAALGRLADFVEQEEEMRSRVRAAMIYPCLIATVGAGTVLFLLAFVVPRLAGLFADMGQELPLITRMLLGANRLLIGPGGILMLAMAVGAPFALKTPQGRALLRRIGDAVLPRLPIWGPLLKKVAVARFSRTLSALLAGGVPILDALDSSADALDHPALKEQVASAAAFVREGAGLAESLRRMPDFPAFICNMIAVGEEGNILEKSLAKVAATYEREAERAMKTATSLLEPLMILAVGAVIGLIVVGLLLPVFDIPTLVK